MSLALNARRRSAGGLRRGLQRARLPHAQLHRRTTSSNSPRICVQFSESLAKGRIDYANFVTVNNEKPASVRVNGAQLCVEDLVHGKRYEVKVRSGIPSTEDDLLPKPVELTVYIRDRSPSVRFSARNYVLPRTGQQGIPVISINTKLVKATIYRIGDRRLADEVLDGDFQKPLETLPAQPARRSEGREALVGPDVRGLEAERGGHDGFPGRHAFAESEARPLCYRGKFAAEENAKTADDDSSDADKDRRRRDNPVVRRFRSRADRVFRRGRRACLCPLARLGEPGRRRRNPPRRPQQRSAWEQPRPTRTARPSSMRRWRTGRAGFRRLLSSLAARMAITASSMSRSRPSTSPTAALAAARLQARSTRWCSPNAAFIVPARLST